MLGYLIISYRHCIHSAVGLLSLAVFGLLAEMLSCVISKVNACCYLLQSVCFDFLNSEMMGVFVLEMEVS